MKKNLAKNRRKTTGDASIHVTHSAYGQMVSDISGLLEQARGETGPQLFGKMSPDDEGEDTL